MSSDDQQDPTTGQRSGRLIKAPEHFLDPEGVRTVFREARSGRRDFIRRAFAGAAAARFSEELDAAV